jgi:predicted alpha/beta superfamily hydrolase
LGSSPDVGLAPASRPAGSERESVPAAPTVNVTLRLLRVPVTTPRDATFFVAGNFNDWNPVDPRHRLDPVGDGTWAATVDVEPDTPLELKVTRGSWDTVEKGPHGEEVPNRFIVAAEKDLEVRLCPAAWRDQVLPLPDGHTLTGAITVIERFPAAELGGERRIWIYLPPGYEDNVRSYPVLYMHDGQNVFDSATSFAGEWQVDETLDRLWAEGRTSGIIVVAVDNAGPRRLDEYSPFRDRRLGKGGAGDAYLGFLVNTLKPHIDRSFRTRPEAAHTGIAGSSMGGLISLYASYRYPAVFGKVGALSPSLDFAHGALARLVRRVPRPAGVCIWLDMGGRESGLPREDRATVEMVVRFHRLLLERGFSPSETRLVLDGDGMHNEASWAKRFPEVVTWLFGE